MLCKGKAEMTDSFQDKNGHAGFTLREVSVTTVLQFP